MLAPGKRSKGHWNLLKSSWGDHEQSHSVVTCPNFKFYNSRRVNVGVVMVNKKVNFNLQRGDVKVRHAHPLQRPPHPYFPPNHEGHTTSCFGTGLWCRLSNVGKKCSKNIKNNASFFKATTNNLFCCIGWGTCWDRWMDSPLDRQSVKKPTLSSKGGFRFAVSKASFKCL